MTKHYGPSPASRERIAAKVYHLSEASRNAAQWGAEIAHDPALPVLDRSVNAGWVLDRLAACDLVTPNGRRVRDMLIRHLERELESAP